MQSVANKDDKWNFKGFHISKKEAIISELLQYATRKTNLVHHIDYEQFP